MFTSFVVIAYNEERTVKRAIESILRQADDAGREVLVIDDGSIDQTAQVVEQVCRTEPSVRLVRLGTNRGRGFARHRGVSLAQGALIGTVDADIVLPSDWLTRCLDELGTADAVCGTAVPDGDVAFLHSAFQLRPRPVGHSAKVTGSNALYRRQVFDNVSFDPTLREGEDVAFSHELEIRGVVMRTVPGLLVPHRESKSATQAFAWMIQSGRGATRQLIRYRRIRHPDVAFLGWLAALIYAARRPRWLGRMVLSPGVYTAAVAAAHVKRSFSWCPSEAPRFVAAVLADTVMLTLYFGGRVLGIPAGLGHPRRETGADAGT